MWHERVCRIMCVSLETEPYECKCMLPTCNVPLKGGWAGFCPSPCKPPHPLTSLSRPYKRKTSLSAPVGPSRWLRKPGSKKERSCRDNTSSDAQLFAGVGGYDLYVDAGCTWRSLFSSHSIPCHASFWRLWIVGDPGWQPSWGRILGEETPNRSKSCRVERQQGFSGRRGHARSISSKWITQTCLRIVRSIYAMEVMNLWPKVRQHSFCLRNPAPETVSCTEATMCSFFSLPPNFCNLLHCQAFQKSNSSIPKLSSRDSSMSCLDSLVFFCRPRVYGGSCKTSGLRRFQNRL